MDTSRINIVSICSGVGQLDRGVHSALGALGLGSRTVCYVEREAYAIEVLATRMEEKALDEAPIWTDVGTFDGAAWRGLVDCVVAGIPCQGHSVAGKRRIANDHRNLWPQTRTILRDSGTRLFALENVGGFLIPNRAEGLEAGIRRVVHDLAEDGWVGRWGTLRASDVGANHRRERVFLLAYNRRDSLQTGRAGLHGEAEDAQAGLPGDPELRRMPVSRVVADDIRPRPQRDQSAPRDARDAGPTAECCGGLASTGGDALCDAETGSSCRNGFRCPNGPASSGRSGNCGTGCAGRDSSSRLANAAGEPRCSRMPESQREPDRRETTDGTGEGIPLFAPARNDYAEWLRVLAIDPTLMPAVRRPKRGRVSRGAEVAQSAIRSVVNGMGARLGFRADELRCIGNGVVWLQAAVAFDQLYQRLKDQINAPSA